VPTERKHAILSFIEENGRARVGDFINGTRLRDDQVKALLSEMVRDGTIEKVGKNRYAYYILKA